MWLKMKCVELSDDERNLLRPLQAFHEDFQGLMSSSNDSLSSLSSIKTEICNKGYAVCGNLQTTYALQSL